MAEEAEIPDFVSLPLVCPCCAPQHALHETAPLDSRLETSLVAVSKLAISLKLRELINTVQSKESDIAQGPDSDICLPVLGATGEMWRLIHLGL